MGVEVGEEQEIDEKEGVRWRESVGEAAIEYKELEEFK